MRIKLSLRPEGQRVQIPINYQYPISSAIYSILSSSSAEYARFLHDRGYLTEDGKPMKLFVFSRLFIPDVEQVDNTLVIHSDRDVTLLVSSPMLNDFVQNFVMGLFEQKEIVIANRYACGRFLVERIETMPLPEILSNEAAAEPVQVKFKCLSPIVASTKEEYDGRISIHYLRPGDERLGEVIRQNLFRKHKLLYASSQPPEKFEMRLDEEYIARMGGNDRITKLVTIGEGDGFRETKVKAFICPLWLKGGIRVLRTAYECGIGSKNSLGFGMLEVVNES